MANLLDDTLNFGFGLFAYSREKLESFVEKMVESGKVEKRDAQGFMRELVQKGDEQRKEIKSMIKEEVKQATSDMGLNKDSLTKDDVRAIIREELAAANKKD